MIREHKPPYTEKREGVRVARLENRGCDFYDERDRENVIMMSLSEMGFYFGQSGLRHWDDEDLCVGYIEDLRLGYIEGNIEGESWAVKYREEVRVLELSKHRDCYEMVRELLLGIRELYKEGKGK